MPDENPTPGRRRGRVLLPVALASLAAAVALPVSAALAGGGDAATGDGAPARALQSVQQPQEGERPPGHDCPDEERGGAEEEDGSASAEPEV